MDVLGGSEWTTTPFFRKPVAKMSEPSIVFCGCHEAGLKLFHALREEGLSIDHLVTLSPDQGKRYAVSGYHDYRSLAEEAGIPVYTAKTYSLSDPADRAFFAEQRFTLLVQGGWQRLFPAHVLSNIRIGGLGVHGSADFLPKGRGRSPLNWSLIEDRKRFIVQLFLMDAGADDGRIIDFADFEINEFDDIRTLYYKVQIVSTRLHLENIPRLLNDDVELREQVGEASYFPKRTPRDGLLNWEEQDAREIYNAVRAQTKPYPGAFAQLDDTWVRIWRCRPFDTRILYPNAAYGDVVERFDGALIVNCRGGLLLIEDYEALTSAEQAELGTAEVATGQ